MSIRRMLVCVAKALILLLLLIFVRAAVPSQQVLAAQSVEVSSEEELLLAVADDTVNAVALTASSVVLTEGFTVDRDISFSGAGCALIFDTGAQMKITEGATVQLSGLRLESTEGYSVSSHGTVELGENVIIAGDYGILLSGGASLTSGGNVVNVAPAVGRAVGVSTQGKQVTLRDVCISQTSGSSHLVYLHQSSGMLRLEGNVKLSSNNSNAIMCPNNGTASPSVTIASGANVNIYAPGASNTGGSSAGAAIDTKYGAVKIENGATTRLTGSQSAINASSIDIGADVTLNISCNSGRSSGAALYAEGAVNIGENAVVSIGMEEGIGCGGIYSGEGIKVGCYGLIMIHCQMEAENAVYSGGAVTFEDDASINIRNAKNGIVCKNGMTTGSRCTIDIADISGYGISSSGKLIADKLYFGTYSTIEIIADYCAIYTCEALHIDNGGRAELSSGTKAPALWIAADKDSPGYATISGSNVTVASGAGASAALNTGVYVMGAFTVENGSVFYSENSADFSVTVVNGDVNVSSSASMYVRSGCGLYVQNGDVRLSSGGSLFSQGLRDSALRINGGVANIGERAVIDLQGARFGAELLGDGGLWIDNAYSFDIRSTSERAVYIENGSFSVENVERISAWERGENNEALWWSGADDTAASWELTDGNSKVVQNYAQHTRLAPSGAQSYRNGEPVGVSTLNWFDADWNMVDYSRIGMYKSRPTARANTFNIPAGRSFSWWLYGESYDGTPATFQLYSSAGEGEFELNEDGRFTYTAPSYVRGEQSFSFTVTNGEGVTSEPTTVKILVTASKPPIVFSTTFLTKKNEPILGQLNVHDYDGAISDTVISRQPDNGTITISSDGKFLYTPNEDFVGIDEFEYYAVDDYGDSSNTGYVSIVVGAMSGLVASNDTYATESDAAINARLVLLDPTAAVTSATDINDDALRYQNVNFVITQRPQYGNFSVSEDGMVTYTPYEDFAGSDMFKFYAEDNEGNRSNEAIVTIAIIPSKRPTVSDGYFTCAKNYYCDGKAQAEDIDGNVMSFELTSQPESGTLTFDEQTGEFRYEPDSDFLGLVSFNFTATDDDGLVSSEGVVYIEVMTLINNLRVTGRLTGFILAGVGIAAAVAVIAVLLISAAAKRHRRELLEMQEYYRSIGYYDAPSGNSARHGSGKKRR